jgi:hypothetical protein
VIQETSQRVPGKILSLAREIGLSSHDASSLEQARRQGLPLATLDHGLRHAAAKVGFELFPQGVRGSAANHPER